ncbi:MAG: Transcriptional regulator [Thermodesulfobacteria bacterium]|nr:hypothetical protein [Thermodesulfobacteriota bacterium]MCU4137459.1 Transcriptional regulator [Thermodesulfobacteriota bacterium]
MPWYPQTKASVEERLQLLDLILSKEPEVGWELLLSLVPKDIGEVTTPIHKPYFMDWAEEWKPEITIKEYWDYVFGICEKIKKYSKENIKKYLSELIEILEYFPKPVFDSIIEDLKIIVDSISPEKRIETYEKLFEIICKHRKFLVLNGHYQKKI